MKLVYCLVKNDHSLIRILYWKLCVEGGVMREVTTFCETLEEGVVNSGEGL